MATPHSTKFNIVDYDYRAVPGSWTNDEGAVLLSDTGDPGDPASANPVTEFAFIQYPNVIVENGSVTFAALGSATNAALKLTTSLILQGEDLTQYDSDDNSIGEGIPENFTFEFDLVFPPEFDANGEKSVDLPLDFSDVENRVVVGAFNEQGHCACFAFSFQGIALLQSPIDPQPTLLAGTEPGVDSKFFDGDGWPIPINIRAVVDGENSRISIYTAHSDAAYGSSLEFTDAEIAWNLPAPENLADYGDAVLVQGTAQSQAYLAAKLGTDDPLLTAAQDAVFSIRSLKLSGTKTYPTDRPFSEAFCPKVGQVRVPSQLNGENSRDAFGRTLTYNWEFVTKPLDSTTILSGASYGYTTLKVVDEPGEDPRAVAHIICTEPTIASNNYVVEVTVGPKESYVQIDFEEEPKELGLPRVLSIQLGADSDGNPRTTAGELIAAFHDQKALGYNYEIAGGEVIASADGLGPDGGGAVVGGVETDLWNVDKTIYARKFRVILSKYAVSADDLLQSGVFQFANGAGSSHMNPTFIPDVPGLYGFSLVVNNGIRDSWKDLVPFTATVTDQLLGHRPNSNYIFSYLSDFWKLVKDKGQLPAIWSAITQAVAGDMLQVWQNDFAKVLRDVSRKGQRRWQKHQLYEYFPEAETSGLITPPIGVAEDGSLYNGAERGPVEVTAPLPGKNSSQEALSHIISHTAPYTTGPVLVRSNFDKPRIAEITEVRMVETLPGEPPDWLLVSNKKAFPYYYTLANRTGGYFIKDPDDITPTTPLVSMVLSDQTYPVANKIDVALDRIRLFTEGEDLDETVDVETLGVGGSSKAMRLNLSSPREVNGYRLLWDHLRLAERVSVEQLPYFNLPSEVNTSSYDLSFGDTLICSYVDPYSAAILEVELCIIASEDNLVFVEWQPLFDILTASSIQAGDSKLVNTVVDGTPVSVTASNKDWTYEDISDVDIFPKGIRRCRRTDVSKDLVSIPSLSVSSVYPQDGATGLLFDRIDYQIVDNRVVFHHLLAGTLRTEAGTDTVEFLSIRGKPGILSTVTLGAPSELITALQAYGSVSVLLSTGLDSGCYYIKSWNEDGTLVLDRPLEDTADVVFSIPVYGCYSSTRYEHLWSELSYYDNSKTIEDNFGVVIGFPKEFLDRNSSDLDYLSVVKSIWFAFMSGPNFSNIQTATQAFFALPYAEVKGQITFIDAPISSGQVGSITLTGDDDHIYLYDFPFGAEIAVNPTTGRPLQQHKKLDVGEKVADEDKYADSLVDAYTRLVDVIEIDDYITNPDLVARQFSGKWRRYTDDDGVEHKVDLPPTIIEKFHTFIVDVPLNVTKSTEVFPLVKAFLNETKPAHTNFILVGSIKFSDEIDVQEDAFLLPTLFLKDTPHTAPFYGPGESPVPDDKLLKMWPTERTTEKVAGIDYSTITDVVSTYVDSEGDTQPLKMLLRHTSPTTTIHPQYTYTPVPAYGGQRGRYTMVPTPLIGVLDITGTFTEYTDLGEAIKDWWDLSPRSAGYFHEGHLIIFSVHLASGWFPFPAPIPPGSPFGYEFELDSVYPNGFNQNLIMGKDIELFLFDDPPALLPDPGVSYWTAEPLRETIISPYTGQEIEVVSDVFEKFESSYCEGVVDDYSGDGSWNRRRESLDMVNSLNSDTDVMMSRIWVPVVVSPHNDFTTQLSGLQVGEEVEFVHTLDPVNGDKIFDSIWNDAPPVILHVGIGHRLLLPFGIEDPFVNHKYTYVLLGFHPQRRNRVVTVDESNSYDYPADGLHNYGREDRLDVLKTVRDAALAGTQTINDGAEVVLDIGEWLIRGKDSGAMVAVREETDPHGGDFQETLDRTKPEHAQFFLLETMNQIDKLIESGPKSTSEYIITKYIPNGGTVILDYQLALLSATNMAVQVQSNPYDSTHPSGVSQTQIVPAFNPGLYSYWGDLNPAVDLVRWGWLEPPDPVSLATPHVGLYNSLPGVDPLENVHMGFKVRGRKDLHLTHGFCEFSVFDPIIKMVAPSDAGYDIRIGGFYFCDDDLTRVDIPTADPTTYGDPANGIGKIGGMWIFFRHVETEEEVALQPGDWEFETGTWPGRPIVPAGRMVGGAMQYIKGRNPDPGIIGDPGQRSDGHIVEMHIPDLVHTGYYDIILRNYRPHRVWSGGAWTYRMTEAIAHKAYYYEVGGYGGITFGTGPYGGA